MQLNPVTTQNDPSRCDQNLASSQPLADDGRTAQTVKARYCSTRHMAKAGGMVRQMVQTEKSTGCVAASSPTYDVAGNLTYDGLQCYTYDAWNRLATMAHGYRDATGVHSGGVLSTCGYDGRGRRISKAITGTGSLDCTYQYYYDQDSLTETRNGSDIAIKQQVWGRQYVDELVQVAVNSDQSTDNSCDALYWACQDANYNVLGLVDNQGVLAERYEYTPYGQRTVFFSPGVNDVGCYASTLTSRKIVVGGVAQPYGLCEFGHQGLQHDEESGLIYNRARMLQPVLGRFMQRDPLGYVDGMSVYQDEIGSPIGKLDFWGMQAAAAPVRSGIDSSILRYNNLPVNTRQSGRNLTVPPHLTDAAKPFPVLFAGVRWEQVGYRMIYDGGWFEANEGSKSPCPVIGSDDKARGWSDLRYEDSGARVRKDDVEGRLFAEGTVEGGWVTTDPADKDANAATSALIHRLKGMGKSTLRIAWYARMELVQAECDCDGGGWKLNKTTVAGASRLIMVSEEEYVYQWKTFDRTADVPSPR